MWYLYEVSILNASRRQQEFVSAYQTCTDFESFTAFYPAGIGSRSAGCEAVVLESATYCLGLVIRRGVASY